MKILGVRGVKYTLDGHSFSTSIGKQNKKCAWKTFMASLPNIALSADAKMCKVHILKRLFF
jgi:hypothetical protein